MVSQYDEIGESDCVRSGTTPAKRSIFEETSLNQHANQEKIKKSDRNGSRVPNQAPTQQRCCQKVT